MTVEPLVSVVIVNFNGERYLRGLLPSLLDQTYPNLEIVIVDNASTDASLEFLADLGPQVRVVRSPRNLGYAAGNNLGIATSRGKHVAILNSDTVVDREWLRQLVLEVERDPGVAAVGSKIVFFKPYLPLTLRLSVDHGLAGGGLYLDEASRIDGCSYRKPLFPSGFSIQGRRRERTVRWSGGHGELLLPFEPSDGDQTLVLIAAGENPNAGRGFSVEIRGRVIGSAVLTGDFAEHRFVVPGEEVARHGRDLINNAASSLDERGVVADRGIYALDEGEFDRPEDVSALCGCSMLVRKDVFQQVGGFDPAFFMYFEDVDLSWRLRRKGFRLRYQPASVVRHVHAGTSSEGSPLFVFCIARNRLLMLLKNAPWSSAAAAWYEELRHTVSLSWRWLRSARSAEARRASFARLWLRLRVLASALVHAPAAIAQRG